jgi:hypothetical protein
MPFTDRIVGGRSGLRNPTASPSPGTKRKYQSDPLALVVTTGRKNGARRGWRDEGVVDGENDEDIEDKEKEGSSCSSTSASSSSSSRSEHRKEGGKYVGEEGRGEMYGEEPLKEELIRGRRRRRGRGGGRGRGRSKCGRKARGREWAMLRKDRKGGEEDLEGTEEKKDDIEQWKEKKENRREEETERKREAESERETRERKEWVTEKEMNTFVVEREGWKLHRHLREVCLGMKKEARDRVAAGRVGEEVGVCTEWVLNQFWRSLAPHPHQGWVWKNVASGDLFLFLYLQNILVFSSYLLLVLIGGLCCVLRMIFLSFGGFSPFHYLSLLLLSLFFLVFIVLGTR